MQLPDKKELKDFEKWKKSPPSIKEHGIKDTSDNPLSEQLLDAKARNWHMEGNELCCDTEFGSLRQRIPVDWICHGTDDNGLPIMRKVVL